MPACIFRLPKQSPREQGNASDGYWVAALSRIFVMADADEDVIPRSGPVGEDVDLSDETQDFRFLAALS